MPNASQVVSISAPASVQPGEQFSASITYKNTGDTVWSNASNYKLGSESPRDNLTWHNPNRISLPNDVQPNEEVTFTDNFTAPTTTGTKTFAWAMVQDFVGWFGPVASQQIAVEGTNPDPPPSNGQLFYDLPSPRTDAADLVGKVIIDTNQYPADGVASGGQITNARNAIWTYDGTVPFKILSSYVWSGVGKGLICDCHAELIRESDETLLNVVQWDRYAEPTAPNNSKWRDYQGYHLINPGETLRLTYYTVPFNNGPPIAHHRAAIWGVYL